MGKYTKWLDLAAEEALSTSIQSSMEVCSQIRKDEDDKNDIDHDKIESLQYCWHSMYEIMEVSDPVNEEPEPVQTEPEVPPNMTAYTTSTGKFITNSPTRVNPNNYITAKI